MKLIRKLTRIHSQRDNFFWGKRLKNNMNAMNEKGHVSTKHQHNSQVR